MKRGKKRIEWVKGPVLLATGLPGHNVHDGIPASEITWREVDGETLGAWAVTEALYPYSKLGVSWIPGGVLLAPISEERRAMARAAIELLVSSGHDWTLPYRKWSEEAVLLAKVVADELKERAS